MGSHHAPEAGAPRSSGHKRRLTIVLLLTSTYLVAEVVGGLLTSSLALLADAGHMLTDVAGLALALAGLHFAERPATPERTYGYYRVEILAAVANCMLLLGISGYVLYESYERFLAPPAIQTGPMLWVAAIGLGVNLIGVLILRTGAGESLNLKGAYFEVLSDLLTSVGVIIAALIMRFTGWYYADPLLSAGIGLLILPRTWMLLREAVGVLLEGTPSNVNLASLREALVALPGVIGVHDLHVWTITSGMNAMSVHVVREAAEDPDDILLAARACVTSRFPIAHVTVQVESAGCEAGETHL